MELSSSYDFILFGDHPAGLWAAKHLLSLDKKVLYVPIGDHRVPNAIPKQILREFEIGPIEHLNRDQDPIQVLGSRHRFRLSGSQELIDLETQFQFGTREDSAIPMEMKRGVRYLLGLNESDSAGIGWNQSIKTLLSLVFLEREAQTCIQKILQKLSGQGLHLARPGQLKRIFVDRGNFVGIQLSQNSKMIPASFGMVASHYGSLINLMSEDFKRVSSPTGFFFDLRFECAPHSIPRGISSKMIYVERESPILEILQEAPGAFLLRTSLPYENSSLNAAFQRRLSERMLRVASRYILDLEYNLKKMVPDLRDSERAETVELPSLFPYADVKQIPPNRLVFQNSSTPPGAMASALGNVFFANEEASLSRGVYGAYHSVVQMFESLGKKKDSPLAGSSFSGLETI